MYVNEMEFDCQMSSFELEYINHMNTIIDFSVSQNENMYAPLCMLYYTLFVYI